MTKIKSILMLLIGAVLAVFIYENWVAAPHIKLFGKELIQLNISVIILVFFSLGFILGWLTCFSWRRAQRKSAAALSEQKAPEPQGSTQHEAKQE
jgi:type VI protein secretion system component VasK